MPIKVAVLLRFITKEKMQIITIVTHVLFVLLPSWLRLHNLLLRHWKNSVALFLFVYRNVV